MHAARHLDLQLASRSSHFAGRQHEASSITTGAGVVSSSRPPSGYPSPLHQPSAQRYFHAVACETQTATPRTIARAALLCPTLKRATDGERLPACGCETT